MTIDRVRPLIFRVTLHGYELSALVAAGRWMVHRAEMDPDVPTDAVKQMEQVLASYEGAMSRLDEPAEGSPRRSRA